MFAAVAVCCLGLVVVTRGSLCAICWCWMLLLSFVAVCQCCCLLKFIVSVVVGIVARGVSLLWFVVCCSLLLVLASGCC